MTSSEPPATVSLSDPGDLIAATPVLLGFVPRSSLVAMSLGGVSGRRLGLTLRIDLPPPEHIAGAAEAVVHGILLDKPAAVVLLVIGPGGDAGPPAVELVERVIACLGSRSIEAPHALWTESTAAGSRWRCYGECGCTGVVPRSSASALAAAARAEGRIVRADRAELERLVAPVDAGVLMRREALLDAAVDAEADTLFARIAAEADGAFAEVADPEVADPEVADPEAADPEAADPEAADPDAAEPDAAETRQAPRAYAESDPRADVIEGIAALDAALDAAHAAMAAPDDIPDDLPDDLSDNAASGAAGGAASGGGHPPGGGDHWLDDEQVVALTLALRSPAVREAAIAACTGSRPEAAAALWAALSRGTPDPEAAEPAALLALTGLLQGDGALANVALQRAEAAWPGHRFTATLRGLAAIGIRPGELRNCLTGAPMPGVSRQRPKHRGRARGGGSRSARRRRHGR